MIQVEDREQIRQAHFIDGKSVRQIAREQGHSRTTVKKALADAEPEPYRLSAARVAPVLGAYRAQIDALLVENETLPRKQRRTIHQIYLQLQAAQYTGSESSVRSYIWQQNKQTQRMPVYLPLEFDPGQYAQADWGEAEVVMVGERLTAQFFVIRLCYSRRLFVKAYPTQRQEAFLDAHVAAFQCYGGVPRHITYDNLTAAVQQILTGRQRVEQRLFIALRSHYVFDSRFCTPGQGHEKGGVESAVGYVRRNFMSPPPQVNSWGELNARLLASCLADEARTVAGQSQSIGELFRQEQPQLRDLPAHVFAACLSREVTLNGYSQVTFETNRYSVPADEARKHLTLKAYPFHIEILCGDHFITRHPRSYAHQQEIVDWKDYLPLLAERPGAFEHAKPLRAWRKHWPPLYEQLFTRLQTERGVAGDSVPEFVRILQLLREHPVEEVDEAIEDALRYGCIHWEGVKLCLHHVQHPDQSHPILDLQHQPHLQTVGTQTLDVQRYDRLLLLSAPHGAESAGAAV